MSFLSFEDMMACCLASSEFCAFTRSTKAFGDKAMFTISNKRLEEGTFLKDTKHSWRSVSIIEPLLKPSAYKCIDRILGSVTTLRMKIRREEADHFGRREVGDFLRHVIGQCQNLKSLQVSLQLFTKLGIFKMLLIDIT